MKENIIKLKNKTDNLFQDKLSKLRELFPNLVSVSKNGKENILKFNWETLNSEYGHLTEKENYELKWLGKSQSKEKSYTSSENTLRPNREKSLNFDKTKNLYIEGDNLEALKLLRATYLHSVDVIYIDPPYNTGNDFIYKDDYSMEQEEYDELNETYDFEDNQMEINTKSNSKYHSNWLSMMNSRLLVARDLLSDEGVIFISIDDNEQANLKVLCDEIFGEENFVSLFLWQKSNSPSGNTNQNKRLLNNQFEYILIYAKNKNILNFNIKIYDDNELNKQGYKLKDEYFEERGYYKLTPLWRNNSGSTFEYVKSLDYGIIAPNGEEFFIWQNEGKKDFEKCRYTWGKETFEEGNKLGFIEIKRNSKNQKWEAFRKVYSHTKFDPKSKKIINQKAGIEYNNLFNEATTITGGNELKKMNLFFSFSKPWELIKRFLDFIPNKNVLVLDFFSGSATTAQAILNKNKEDNGQRQFIMVQIPEKTNSLKSKFSTICELGQERIRRVGKTINETHPSVDTGFRVLTIDTPNFENKYFKAKETSQKLLSQIDYTLKEDRTNEDLLFQAMIHNGVHLNSKIEIKTINNHQVYFVNDNELIAYFEKKLDESVLEEIGLLAPKFILINEKSLTSDIDSLNMYETIHSIQLESKLPKSKIIVY